MNVENVKKVRDKIASHPEKYDQTVVVHDCGTPACIAGYASLMEDADRRTHHMDAAREFLGLSGVQASLLFSAIPYEYPGFAPPTVDEALAVLDHLIETGKVRWPPRDQEDEK